MTRRRPTDGWVCKQCQGVYFKHYSFPLCPWCFREAHWANSPKVREKLRAISRRLQRITDRDGWDCWLCKEGVDPYDLGPHRASADHVVPKSAGGKNYLSNLKLAHQSCNGYRSGSRQVPFAPFDRHATFEAL